LTITGNPPTIGGVATPVRPATQRAHPAAKKAQKGARAAARRSKKVPSRPLHGGAPGGGNVADPIAHVHTDDPHDPKDPWQRPGPTIRLLGNDFQLWLIRKGFGRIRIDTLATDLSWDDAQPVLTGQLNLRVAQDTTKSFEAHPGDLIVLKARDTDARMKEWWRMKITTPGTDYASGSRTFQLASDLHRLYDSQAEFKYRKSTDHPKGWTGLEIIEDVLDQYGFDAGEIPADLAKIRITKYGPVVAAPSDVLVMVLNRFHREHGKRYIIAYDHGQVNIRPYQRTARMLELGTLLSQAGYSAAISSSFATAVYMRSTGTKAAGTDKNKHRKVTHRPLRTLVEADDAIERYGLITRMGFVYADSEQELVQLGKHHLTMIVTPDRTITATHPGVVGLRRHDAVRINVEADEDIFDQVLFVESVSFSLSGGQFDMQVTLSMDDPFVSPAVDAVKDTREEVQARRGRKTSGKKSAKPTKKKSARSAARSPKSGSKPSKTSQRPAPKIGGVSTRVVGR
jgi:hypothetical protein